MTKKKLLTVKQYSLTRTGWRNMPVSVGYIYNLIKQVEAGTKTIEQAGFKPITHGKGYLIEVIV